MCQRITSIFIFSHFDGSASSYIYSETSLSGTLAKWDTSLSGTLTFSWSGIFFYHFIVMKTSLSGTLNKWDISLSGTVFPVPKPKMNLTKWDTLFETFPANNVCKVSLQKLAIIKPMSLIMKKIQRKNVKEKKKMKKKLWVKHWRWLTNSKCIA